MSAGPTTRPIGRLVRKCCGLLKAVRGFTGGLLWCGCQRRSAAATPAPPRRRRNSLPRTSRRRTARSERSLSWPASRRSDSSILFGGPAGQPTAWQPSPPGGRLRVDYSGPGNWHLQREADRRGSSRSSSVSRSMRSVSVAAERNRSAMAVALGRRDRIACVRKLRRARSERDTSDGPRGCGGTQHTLPFLAGNLPRLRGCLPGGRNRSATA
jgi:hypothetical protein